MKITITNVKKNPLMKRKVLLGVIEHDGMPTPSKASVQKFLAKEQKVKENHVDVRKIFSARGREDAKLMAYIWDKKEVPILEEKPKKEGNKMGKEINFQRVTTNVGDFVKSGKEKLGKLGDKVAKVLKSAKKSGIALMA